MQLRWPTPLPSPTLWLLGLLALLVWGQCRLLTRIASGPPPVFELSGLHLDSLTQDNQAGVHLLYLRLQVHNTRRRTAAFRAYEGKVTFRLPTPKPPYSGGHNLGQLRVHSLVVIPARKSRRIALAIPLPYSARFPADSTVALGRLLDGTRSNLRLVFQIEEATLGTSPAPRQTNYLAPAP